MRKAIVAVLIVLLFAVACSDLQSKAAPDPDPAPDPKPRFDDTSMYIVTDSATGCKYLAKAAYGITPLLKSTGKPDCPYSS